MSDYKRPSPDALLASTQRESSRRGRLKLFLGAAPGVGKTYEMLLNARSHRAKGDDVVVGVVETHGRAETQALLDGLEIIPRRTIDYKGRILDDMDIDAVLARRPQLVLVDELAHTNASGSRHPKRYLDVEELLEAGIDVNSTLNIQHVESLNDVVAQITRIRVRETVPDSILDRADDIELIDITPDDLIQRLKEGKIYVPKQAERAVRHYFSPGNLTALRELALRQTAQRVDDQLLTHMKAHAISGPWAAGDRVLVCISEDLRSPGLVRYAKRLADRLHAPWTALSVEGPRALHLSEEERDRVAEVSRLAQQLGGETVTVPALTRRLAEDVIAFAQANNITHVVIGKSNRSRWFEMLHGSVVHDLLRRSGAISVHVIAGEQLTDAATGKKKVQSFQPRNRFDPIPYLIALLSVAGAVAVCAAVNSIVEVNVELVFITAIVAVAIRFGLKPSLLAVAAASLSYNFFFIPPIFTFTVTDPRNVAALFFFAVVAVLVSNLGARTRTQAVALQTRARTTEALYTFSRKLSGAGSIDDVLWTTAFQIASLLKLRVVLLLPDANTVVVKAGYPPEDILDEADMAAAKWSWDNERPAGRGADTLPGAKRLFLPMRTGRGPVGVVGLDSDRPGPLLTPEQHRLFDALSDQGALAIERVGLVEDLDRAKLSVETDRLRSALLTSISHDLKTPLAAVFGSASTLRDLGHALDDAAKADLLSTIIEESERLNRFIANLLDMTKLEAGAISPKLATYDLGEIVGTALQRASTILAAHQVEIHLAPDLPPLRLDPVLMEQALFNLLDNAAKYSNPGSTILIQGWEDAHTVCLQILDEGQGIPQGDNERVFDKFYRAEKGDSVRAGTGLGLGIARGFVEAMGGRISAANRSDGPGAVLSISFPVRTASEVVDQAA